MIAIATRHSLGRFYLIALTITIPRVLLQNKIWFSTKHILKVSVSFYVIKFWQLALVFSAFSRVYWVRNNLILHQTQSLSRQLEDYWSLITPSEKKVGNKSDRYWKGMSKRHKVYILFATSRTYLSFPWRPPCRPSIMTERRGGGGGRFRYWTIFLELYLA